MKDKETYFRQVYEENKDRIFRICCSYVKEEQDRLDLYQEILTKVWESLGSFKGKSQISTWLYRVAVNTALMYVSKSRKQSKQFQGLDQHEFKLATNEEDKLHKIQLESDIERLYACINQLDIADKTVISLYLEELSYKEIAQVTGLAVSHIGVKINRIKQKLATLLTKETEHGI